MIPRQEKFEVNCDFQKFEDDISCITMDQKNKYLFVTSSQGALKIFSVKNLVNKMDSKILDLTKIHDDYISCMAIDHDSEYLLTGSYDRYLKICKIDNLITEYKNNPTEEIVKRQMYVKSVNGHLSSLSMGYENEYIYCGMFTYVVGKDQENRDSLFKSSNNDDRNCGNNIPKIKGSINIYKFIKDQKKDVEIDKDIQIHLELFYELTNIHEDIVNTILIDNVNDWILTISNADKSIRIFSVVDQFVNERQIISHKFEINSYLQLAFVHDNENLTGLAMEKTNRFLFCTSESSLSVYNICDLKNNYTNPMLMFKNYVESPIKSMCIDLKNKYLLTSCEDRSLKLLRIEDIQNITLENYLNFTDVHERSIDDMIISTNNKWLISHSKKQINVLDINSIWNVFRTYNEHIDVYFKEDINLLTLKTITSLNLSKIDYFNETRRMNLFTYNLLQELILFKDSCKRQERLKQLLIECNDRIFAKYSTVKKISIFDIQAMSITFRSFELDDVLVKFICTVVGNQLAEKPSIFEIFEWLLILLNGDKGTPYPLNDKLGESLITTLIKNQFAVLKDFTRGSSKLIQNGIVNAATNQHLVNGQFLSDHEKKLFYINDYNRELFEIEVKTF